MAAAIGSVIACAGVTSPAHADDDDSRAKTLGLHIVPSIDISYEDNIYRVDRRVEDPIGDVIVSPSIEAQFDKAIGRHDLNLRALLGYDQFVSQSQRSKPRIEAGATGAFRFGTACSITPAASYRQQRADYGDINRATENLQHFSTVSADLSCDRTAGFYPLARYRRDTTRNADAFDYADQTSDTYRAGLGYRRPSLGAISLYYEHVTSDRGALGISNRSNAAGVTFQRAVSPLTSIDVDLRWLDVSSSSAVIGRYRGPGWTVSASTSIIPRVKITGFTERAIVNDSLIASGFAIRSSYRLTGEIGLSELTSISVFSELERRRFRQDAALRPFSYTADRTNEFGAALRRKLSERTELQFVASRYDRRTDSSVANYRGIRLTLGATARF
ncbi:hypothetical protein [Sphingomonas sp.]|uniref:hypothetical protein n=1 Tax=Sphingomonas sp. TaxID=28214 RepID=UPI003D6D6A7F